MDSYTVAIVSFLQDHRAVAAVHYQPHEPCVQSDLVRWEARHQPFKFEPNRAQPHLPADCAASGAAAGLGSVPR
jgi:hypothetical protein